MQIRAILFDWGGTLARVDGQADALMRGAADMLQILGASPQPDLLCSLMVAAVEAEKAATRDPEHREVDLGGLLRAWGADHGLASRPGQADLALEAIGRNWVGNALSLMEGVPETLHVLRAMGLQLGLVSNCFVPQPYCTEELRHQGIADLLDCAVFSSEIGYRKPSRRIYAEALRRLADAGGPGDYAQVLFVGDSPAYDVITPGALGMATTLVSSTAGLWSAEDYERARPDFRIDSVTELPGLLADLS